MLRGPLGNAAPRCSMADTVANRLIAGFVPTDRENREWNIETTGLRILRGRAV
jgi:hypothetical protein